MNRPPNTWWQTDATPRYLKVCGSGLKRNKSREREKRIAVRQRL
jgi:hypothetical protein